MSSALTLDTDIDEIIDNFSFLDDWDDRYGYLIELGRALTPIDDALKNDATKVQGCVSQVWVISDESDGLLRFKGASDAHIVSGLVAVTLALFSDKTPAEILSLDERETFRQIGLEEHITPQRANGLRAMVERIKTIAAAS